MGTWLKEFWTDGARFAALLRGIGVALGLFLLSDATGLAARWGGTPGLWSTLGVLLGGGSAAVPAGQKNESKEPPKAP